MMPLRPEVNKSQSTSGKIMFRQLFETLHQIKALGQRYA